MVFLKDARLFNYNKLTLSLCDYLGIYVKVNKIICHKLVEMKTLQMYLMIF
jgi:hypothetical protein